MTFYGVLCHKKHPHHLHFYFFRIFAALTLPYGVTVARLILVQPVVVRIHVREQSLPNLEGFAVSANVASGRILFRSL